jgi:hypothetical protein
MVSSFIAFFFDSQSSIFVYRGVFLNVGIAGNPQLSIIASAAKQSSALASGLPRRKRLAMTCA